MDNAETTDSSTSIPRIVEDIKLSIRKLWIKVRKLEEEKETAEIEWSHVDSFAAEITSGAWYPREQIQTVNIRIVFEVENAPGG